jgi:DNA-binding Lrp family transcriptional regulator
MRRADGKPGARTLAKSVGISYAAMLFRMRNWSEDRWLSPVTRYAGKRSDAARLASEIGISVRAASYRIKRWPESRWKEPGAPNALVGRKGRVSIW